MDDKRSVQIIIGNNLRKYRLLAKLTQDELAEKAGISTPFLANLERRHCSSAAEHMAACRTRVQHKLSKAAWRGLVRGAYAARRKENQDRMEHQCGHT